MRIDKIRQNNKNVPSRFRIGTPGGDEMAILSTLMDISETLAIIADEMGSFDFCRTAYTGDKDNADGK